ncbi:hypothetical protein PHMEG_00024541 [Phytophthora megakarya]|uniref:Integrase catalytic domain-containing protein n=1 Tax=Phytophthora megakarya TaxID=4795 RepID=A0A225VFI3_9STRA|nr:hypothetical protein PHMEG_00024541 [Phytophthora megakarya]
MYTLCSKLKCDQQFSVAYCPWINGSIERLNIDILQVFRTMILEYKLDHREWMSLISVVQGKLNHTALPYLAYKSPLELFTGLHPPSPFAHTFVERRGRRVLIETGSSDKIERSLAQLRVSIQNMHRAVIGDFVLRSHVDEKHLNKLLVTWVGPYVVTETHPRYFVVKDLVTGKSCDVHASRLKFFADKDLQVSDELLQHIASQSVILDVKEIKQHRWNSERQDFELFTSWRGLEEIEDSWQSFTPMTRDVQVLVDRYVTATEDT